MISVRKSGKQKRLNVINVKSYSWLLLSLLIIIFGCATAGKSSNTPTSRTQSPRQFGTGNDLVDLEAKAETAEKEGRWADASSAYLRGLGMARVGGQYQKAILFGDKAIELGEKANQPAVQAEAIFLTSLAYNRLGQAAKARDLLEHGLIVIQKISPGFQKTLMEANIYTELGALFQQARQFQKAIDSITYALKIQESQLSSYKTAGNRNRQVLTTIAGRMVSTLQRLGTAYQRDSRMSEALSAYDRALRLMKDFSLKVTELDVRLYMSLGDLYLSQKDFQRASGAYQQALEIAEKLGYEDGTLRAATALGYLITRRKQSAEAIPYFLKAIRSIESSRSQLDSEEFRTTFFANKGQTYEGIILAYLRGGNVEQAFNYNERARSRAFLDILGSKVQLGKQGALTEEETALRAKIGELQAKLRGQAEDDDGESDKNPVQARQELNAVQQAYNDFLSRVRKENKEQASLMNVEPLTLDRLQEILDPGVSVLEYFVARDQVHLWVVEKDRIRVVTTRIARADLVSKVTAIRQTISQVGDWVQLKAQSQELYKLLIEPGLPQIRGKQLLIIPHDVLHYLPFQALLSPHGKYLIEDYTINYLSSASLMQFTQEKRRAMGQRVLAFGNPDLGDANMRLQFAEVEAKQIYSLYPQSTVLLDKEATEEKAKTLSPQNDIIHFATHADLNENDPLASAVLLVKSEKEDGRLEVREIFGMDLKANLVVLSACETGLGKLSSGDELVGLTRAFIYAGTPSVVASLWNVEDSSTAQLMASFYKNLKTMSKVEALRQAQLQLIRGNVNSDLLARRGIGGVGRLGEIPGSKLPAQHSVSTAHPYFWAPFILVGDGK